MSSMYALPRGRAFFVSIGYKRQNVWKAGVQHDRTGKTRNID